MPNICVVHLVWRPLGPRPFHDFLASYRRNPGGIDHRLIILFNGFRGESELSEYRGALSDIPHDSIVIGSSIQDIPAYFAAARKLDCEYICFLNSYSEILDADWLAKMYKHIGREGVGIVGATGSWASFLCFNLFRDGKPCTYTSLLQDIHDIKKRKLFGLSPELESELRRKPLPERLLYQTYYKGIVAPFFVTVNSVRFPLERRRIGGSFDPFPAPHLRTNAFLIRRDVMLNLRVKRIRTKLDAYAFESSKSSLTNQLQRAGLKALVAGKDGRAYEEDDWPGSETFCQGEQRNLLVADNQTRGYTNGNPRQRLFLSRFAWGDRANPSLDGRQSFTAPEKRD